MESFYKEQQLLQELNKKKQILTQYRLNTMMNPQGAK